MTIFNGQKCLKKAKNHQIWGLKKGQKRAKTGLGAQRAKKFGIWASQNFFQKCVRACPWPVRPIQKSPIFSLKKFEFPAFFLKNFFWKKLFWNLYLTMNPWNLAKIWYITPISCMKNGTFWRKIRIYHETKMSKITHSGTVLANCMRMQGRCGIWQIPTHFIPKFFWRENATKVCLTSTYVR